MDDDAQYEAGLRPRTLDDYIGQERVRENLDVSIAAARQRGEALDHVLLFGPPGLGQDDARVRHRQRAGRAGARDVGPGAREAGRPRGDPHATCKPREVLFIDEVHRMSPAIEEILYPAMEDFEIDIMIGQGPGARSVKLPMQPFTLIGATTRAGLLTSPLRVALRHRPPARLLRGGRPRRDRHAVGAHSRRGDRARGGARDRAPVARHAAHRQPAAAARPRLRAGAGRRTRHRAPSATTRCELLEVDAHGFDEADRRLLRTIIDKFGGGPVGLNSLAAAIGEEKDAIEDIYEPYLIQIGFLDRTPRGRVATARAYEYFRAHGPGKGTSVVSWRCDR